MVSSGDSLPDPLSDAARTPVDTWLPAAVAAVTVALFALVWRAAASYQAPPPAGITETEEFFFAPTGASPELIFGAALWMLARRWRSLRGAIGASPRPYLGSLVLALGAALWLWAVYVGQLILQIPALSLFLVGGALALGGTTAARRVLTPALFLLLAFPIPSVLLNRIIYPLQLFTASAASAALNLVGIATETSADRIYRGSAVFEVIETCSGLRMFETLLMSAVLYAELFNTSRLRTAILVASVPFLSVLCNEIRVISIVLNPYSHFAAVHSIQGLVMIVVGVLLLAGVDALAGRLLGEREWEPRPRRGRRSSAPYRRGALAFVAAVGLVLAGSRAIVPLWREPAATEPSISQMPAAVDGWNARGADALKQFLGSVRFDEAMHRRYWRGEQQVDLFVGTDRRLDPSRSLLSTKTALPGSGYGIRERWPSDVLGAAGPAEGLIVSDGSQELLVYHWYVGVDSFGDELLRSTLALDRGPLRRPERALVIRVSTPIEPGSGGREGAEARLAAFLSAVDKPLRALYPDAASPPIASSN
ncbi:MAG TPA: EpsI family protein [Myxococcota bacterium]|nr:EpsI family protein [Myxococcota bacterium]